MRNFASTCFRRAPTLVEREKGARKATSLDLQYSIRSRMYWCLQNYHIPYVAAFIAFDTEGFSSTASLLRHIIDKANIYKEGAI